MQLNYLIHILHLKKMASLVPMQVSLTAAVINIHYIKLNNSSSYSLFTEMKRESKLTVCKYYLTTQQTLVDSEDLTNGRV